MRMFCGLRSSIKISLFVSTLVTAVASSQALLETDAKADTADKAKVAVGGFEGAKSDEVRAAFIDALKKDGSYEVTDAEDLKSGTKGKALVDAASGLGVNVVITGKVSKGFGLKLKVLKGSDGKQVDEVEIKGGALPKLKSNIDQSGASSVADAVAKAAGSKKKDAPAADEKKPDAEEAKPDEEKPAEDKPADSGGSNGDKGLSPFDVTAGLRPMHRTFSFNDEHPTAGHASALKYELPLGPLLFIDLNWFPASHFTTGPAEWIGVTAGFEKGFATQSVFAEGTSSQATLKTDQQSFYGGLRFRLPVAAHMLGLTGTFGQHRFALTGDEAVPLIPDVTYSFIRAGLDGNFRFGDFSVGAHVGKRFVLSTGAVKTVWYHNVKASSLEAGLNVGYRLVSILDLVAGFDWLRYAFDFNPVSPAAPPAAFAPIAGGAKDEYLSGYIGFKFHMPGKGESSE